jgi:hypothetical protein
MADVRLDNPTGDENERCVCTDAHLDCGIWQSSS